MSLNLFNALELLLCAGETTVNKIDNNCCHMKFTLHYDTRILSSRFVDIILTDKETESQRSQSVYPRSHS